MRNLKYLLLYSAVAIIAVQGALRLSFQLFSQSNAQEAGAVAPTEVVAESAPSDQSLATSPISNGEVAGPSDGQVPPPPPQAVEADAVVGEGVTAPELTTQQQAELPYVYNSEGRRDPFEPYRSVRAALETSVENRGAKQESDLTPLERWELDQIRIIAILWDGQNPRAMVLTPEGTSHTVTRGVKIGRNFGVIRDIKEGAIVVAEKIFVNGKAKTEIQTMELR